MPFDILVAFYIYCYKVDEIISNNSRIYGDLEFLHNFIFSYDFSVILDTHKLMIFKNFSKESIFDFDVSVLKYLSSFLEL